MKIQEVAEDLRSEFQLEIKATRSDLTQKLDQLTESVLSLDARLREFMSKTHTSTPTSSKNHGSSFDPTATHFRSPETPEQRVLKSIKVEIPSFVGSDPNNWIFKAQMFFQMHNVPPCMKVQLAGIKMEGQASPWFQWMFTTGLISQWEDFACALRQRFGASAFVDLKGTLSKLSQSGTVMEYTRDFESLLNQVQGFSDDVLMSFFISGLQPDLRGAIQLQWPKSLHHAMQLAYALDTHHDQLRSSIFSNQKRNSFSSTSNNTTFPKTNPNSTFRAPTTFNSIPKPLSFQPSTLPIKKLPPEEILRKRELGICFTCDEKWHSKHRCQSKMFLLIGEMDDDQQDTEEEILWSPESKDATPTASIQPNPDATMFSLASSFNHRALILTALLGNHNVDVLVDSGSSHNFINRELATTLGIPMSHSKGKKVFMGNGEFLFCDKKCNMIQLTIQNHPFVIDFWVLDLQDLNAILGMTWLESLGGVTYDYMHQSMEFIKDGQLVKLQGVLEQPHNADCVEKASCYLLTAVNSIEQDGQMLPELEAIKHTLNLALWSVLQECKAVFQTPQILPPFRGMEHSIHLLDGAKPVNVKPYRFPHHQKAELERQVSDLLSAGFIQPSKSPYSSPVLLVKKQDGTWRMCIDYRALNALTVPDRFPIPTIDE
ncbi:uncharacterized protein LOC133312113 [Gastrolobium bilobum]|uniref:uncharacterized protein LOC133312113 n=1 Tax=Gastrolobium bilobum TaxID=150636 RepID=UPI002AB32628|nr:uncharacterized protein LOC133312113 [Gastrolobium bilobum]